MRSKARLFRSSCEFVPHPQLPVTDSPAVLPSVVMLCPARYSPLRSASSLRRDCPHSAPASLQRTDSATLRSFPRSHQSLPADSSFVADCFQSLLPYPLQTAPLPLRCSPRVGGRTPPCVGCGVSASIRRFVPAREGPFYLAPTSVRRSPAAHYVLASSTICARLSSRLSPSRHPVPNSRGLHN